MKLKSIRFRNFESYGNSWSEITFDQDKGALSCILGNIGAGKSSIANVIIYGLYGKLQKKTLKAIPNRFNGHMEVIINLEAGDKDILIHRGYAPAILNVIVNGKPLEGSGKTAVQNILEEEILGIPFHIFNNVITLSINDFVSFIKMTPADKRKIVDKIFGLFILNEMTEVLKKEVDDKNKMMFQISNSLSSIEYSIQNSNHQLENLEVKMQQNFIQKQQEINTAIANFKKLASDLSEKKSKATEKISNFRLLSSDIEKEIMTKKNKLSQVRSSILLYKNNTCPTCRGRLDTDEHKHQHQVLEQEERELQQIVNDLHNTWNEKSTTLSKYDKALGDLDTKLNEVTYRIRSYTDELDKIGNMPNLDEAKNSLLELIKTYNGRMDELKKEESKVIGSKDFLEEVGTLLSDKGIKRLALQQIIPSLNKEIRNVLDQLNCRFRIDFDDQFNAKITELRYEVDIETLSTGESKVVDFAVLISFIKLMKTKFPQLNILFLDEIFSSIDPEHRLIILQILKKMSKDINLNIFVINHSELPYEMFDSVISVYKKDNFSQMTYLSMENE